jgi:hypothetical protein
MQGSCNGESARDWTGPPIPNCGACEPQGSFFLGGKSDPAFTTRLIRYL